MNATRTPIRELPPGTYCCSRCGREATYATRRPKPAMCRDCRDVTEGGNTWGTSHEHGRYVAGCEDCKADRRAARQRAAAKAAS